MGWRVTRWTLLSGALQRDWNRQNTAPDLADTVFAEVDHHRPGGVYGELVSA